MNGYRVFSMVLAAITIAAATDTQAADELTVSKKACAGIVAYNSGTNVHGRKVAPGHLGGGTPIKLPKEFTIDIGAGLEKIYGRGAGGDYTGTVNVGKVKVKNGQITFSG